MVLLVAAVELQQLDSILREADLIISELSEQRILQMHAVELALFRLGKGLDSVLGRFHSPLVHPLRKCSIKRSEAASNTVTNGPVRDVTTTFLLEIGTEELPADFARQALNQLEERVIRDLKEARLSHGPVAVFGSPRRLSLSVAALGSRQPDLEDERKGPPVAQAMQNGAPGPAAIGFARRCGVSPSDLVEKATPKGPCLFATVRTPGRDSGSLLAELIPGWIDALQGRRFMRWGAGSQRFSRPIRWLLALQGSDVIPVSIPGADPVVRSDRLSRGHRLHADAPLRIDNADDYAERLAAAGVVVDRSERAGRIREGIERASEASGGEPDCPGTLFEELVDLVENPRVLRGRISDRFLRLPPEVISTVMQAHQRYVPLRRPDLDTDPLRLSSETVLCPDFLLVSNGLERSASLIIRGNERVLSARLADAEFFLEVDRRQSSSTRREELDRVTYAIGLGSLRDRCDRIERITADLIHALGLPEDVSKDALRAAHLCKHDLVSQMVGEFPELQGLMGGKYLLQEGEPKAVAMAVVEQYLPRGAGDDLPATDAGAVLALAERLELLLSIFAKGERPSGSSDPYALRRAGNGVLQILWHKGWRLDLKAFLSDACGEWCKLFPAFSIETGELLADLVQLLRQRIVSQLEEDGLAVDLVSAVAGEAIPDEQLLSDPEDVRERVNLLKELRSSGELNAVQAVVQRASRLAEKGDLSSECLEPGDVVNRDLFSSPSEHALFDAVASVATAALGRNYTELAAALQQATPALESFFDGESSVMVMCEDAAVRGNRLNLLSVLRNQARVLADFGALQSR